MTQEPSCASETMEIHDPAPSASASPLEIRAGWEDPPRRHYGALIVGVLLPVSAAIAFFVLHGMGSAAAAATGGCGGG